MANEVFAARVASFANLEAGWHYGQGGPISPPVREAALAWFDFVQTRGVRQVQAFPGADGEILLGITFGDHYIEIIAEADGTTTVAHDVEHRSEFQLSNLPLTEARLAVSGAIAAAGVMNAGSAAKTSAGGQR